MPTLPSLRDIYESEFRFVWRILARLGVREAEIPDAMQEVFLVVHRRLSEFDGKCRVSTWLYRICFNVASDRRRRAHVRYEIPVEDSDLERRLSQDDSPTEALATFDHLLESMEIDQRAVFVLFEVEGFNGPEIAEMLECPLPTVYSRLRLARAAFARAASRLQASMNRPLREAAV